MQGIGLFCIHDSVYYMDSRVFIVQRGIVVLMDHFERGSFVKSIEARFCYAGNRNMLLMVDVRIYNCLWEPRGRSY